MANDKKTIGITKSNAAMLNDFISAGYFGSELDAAKFAMAYAIKMGTKAGSADGAETKWNVGSVDPDGTIKAVLEAFYSDVAEPYRLLEYLMNEGIKMLSSTPAGTFDIYDTLFSEKA
jgi:hypothetical protein